MVDINDFEREAECEYKSEYYSVRDNGAVLRHPRKNKRLRKYDNQWTWGKPNHSGYLLIVSEVVHRIVAYAFLGKPPTEQHIVDHIDTNRQNNRPENLRWLTKLENILKNPITVKKIIYHCGSIEAFLEDPSILKKLKTKDPNFEWMRTVTPKEAQLSWKRLKEWSNKENDGTNYRGGSMAEWIFIDTKSSSSYKTKSDFVTSENPNTIQMDWSTQSDFPCCPQSNTNNPIATYTTNLVIDKIFSSNQYCDSIIVDFATSNHTSILWVMCKSSDENSVKPWLLAQVTYENEKFVHENLGSYFKKESAEKQFSLAQGLEWTGGETFDELI